MRKSSLMILLITAILVFGTVQVHHAQAAEKIKVIVDGREANMSNDPIMRNGTILLPFRSLFNALGLSVKYIPEYQSIEAQIGKDTLYMMIKDKMAFFKSETYVMKPGPEVIEGVTYVPLRFIGDRAGYETTWDAATGTVTLTNKLEKQLASVKEYHYKLSEVGSTPYDASIADQIGPFDWSNNYGSSPEIVTYLNPDHSLTVGWQDEKKVYLSEFQADFTISTTIAFKKPLKVFGGFTKDDIGNYYVLYTQNNKDGDFSTNVQLIKYDSNGTQVGMFNLNSDRRSKGGFDIMEPIAHANSRLVYTNGKVAILMGKKQHKNENDGLNHQSGILVVVDSNTMSLLKDESSTQTASHSFDQRLIADGNDFVYLDLADNYPRGFYLTKNGTGKVVFTFKTMHNKEAANPAGKQLGSGKWSNDNRTYSELGGIAASDTGYVVLGSSERSFNNAKAGEGANESRNLFMVHVVKDFDKQTSQGDWNEVFENIVDSGGAAESNAFYDFNGGENKQRRVGVVWLTDFMNPQKENVVRPKLVKLSDGRYVAMWEKWSDSEYLTTQYLIMDEKGNILKKATNIGPVRLNRPDDIIGYGNKVIWVTGDASKKSLRVNWLEL